MVEIYADLERALYIKRSEPKKRLRPSVAEDQDVRRFTVMSATSLGHVAEASRLIDRGCTAIYQVKQSYTVLDCKSAVRGRPLLREHPAEMLVDRGLLSSQPQRPVNGHFKETRHEPLT